MKKLTLAILLGGLGASCGGDSHSEDEATTLSEWRPLAEQGDAEAQFKLAEMYHAGKGVQENNLYAHMWFNIAASQGDAIAATNRSTLAEKMTPAAINAAQELARECVAKEYKGC